ncbi:hypothetical protein RHSIM_Rhsim11G0053300 [Rhododendron simsii]|uniref:Phorbol-ester/DAG-type domain-containing protein n=1 Tax=Rhododendron simsii TaxID=118357 RepID=A0A834L7N2_RHOSS|nr:hypothetical protein RHSIM_Rhsim11G0053300 [Rhododendron simsii]
MDLEAICECLSFSDQDNSYRPAAEQGNSDGPAYQGYGDYHGREPTEALSKRLSFSEQGKSYGPAYQGYCDYHGHEPTFEVHSEGPCFVCWDDISSLVRKCQDISCPLRESIDSPNDMRLGIHDSCAKLPSKMKNHPFHSQHTLTLRSNTSYDPGDVICDACGRRIRWGYNFHCEKCDFDLDPHCATLLTELTVVGENRLTNLNHPHPLILCTIDRMSTVPCSGCNKRFEDLRVYVCLKCHCLLHKSCVGWPSRMEHPFHSQHPLNLHILPRTDMNQNRCSACWSVLEGSFFHCSDCKFSLDLSCYLLMPVQSHREGIELQTQLLNHPHRLIFCENRKGIEVICHGCKQCCTGPVYFCPQCLCFLEKSCAEWPQQIDHPFHPNHPLTLLVKHDPGSSQCKACGKRLQGLIFYCSECEFGLDLLCATLMPPQINQHQQLGHPHPLTLCKKKENLNFTCYACLLPIVDSVYVCFECCILLNRSCANLPRTIIQSPYGQDTLSRHKHTLTLIEKSHCQVKDPLQLFWVPRNPLHPRYGRDVARQAAVFKRKPKAYGLDDQFHCIACDRDTIGFAYACSVCSCYFDIWCTMNDSAPHKHSLALNIKPNKLNCKVCSRPLRTPSFRCEKCNFNIHVSCVPILPQIVHKCHRHALTLTYSPVKDFPDEDETAELYCDVCEETRELVHPTYYCEECHFVSHVHCAYSEEMHVLVEEWDLPFKLDEQKGPELGSLSRADEATGVSAGERDLGRAGIAGNHCSLIELDEEIAVRNGEIECLETKLSTMHEEKEELERRRALF